MHNAPSRIRLPRPALSLWTFGLLAAVGGVTACGDATGPDADFQVIEEVTFAPSLGIDLAEFERLNTGVYIKDEVVGEGEELVWGDRADEVNYTGWLVDGTLFDSGTFGFQMGTNRVIPGFEQGMFGMKAGGVRRIIIPPVLAYGAEGTGSIPPGAILIFEVELVRFTPSGG